ncbi:flagellar assembly protein T N-terminal domain-containing protein [Fuchsiella alkaliacetigena]|uniref:flagellar assembly protein T N-terminal domain-containing protein n=1 Tax=Fuchsiella alkaliacetigena TaxID=957042 RepID=UPI002009E193|nr:flagellar assembly protein T N-terminal domain-containing protein [Fuchsiella alkaliacetigena]MCK8825837.1 flagellar assembly protein T N-terminal domain-containing protein [Fuchsiella alkaliacetigena]
MSKFKLVFLMILCLIASQILAQPLFGATVEVEVEGYGSIIEEDVARARDEALRDAYRLAIEEAGVEVEAITEVRDFQVFYDQVTSQAQGYLRSYEILEEDSEDDLYRVQIKGEVVQENIETTKDHQALKQLLEMTGNPVVMVLVAEENMGQTVNDSSAANSITKQLAEGGYQLVDADQLKRIRASTEAEEAQEGSTEAAVNLGQSFGADVVLTGSIKATERGSYEAGDYTFHGAGASARVQAVSVWTGRVIEVWELEENDSALNHQEAGRRAIKNAAQELGEQIVWNLPYYVGGIEGELSTVQLEVKELDSFSESRELLEAVENLRGVESVNLRSFENGIAQIDLEIESKVEDLAVRIEDLAEFELAVLSLGREQLKLEVE